MRSAALVVPVLITALAGPASAGTSSPAATAGKATAAAPKITLARIGSGAVAWPGHARGTLTPALDGRTVTLQRRVKGTWTKVASARTKRVKACATCTSMVAKYDVPIRSSVTATWTVRASAKVGRLTVNSATQTFRWLAVPMPVVRKARAADVKYILRSGCPVPRKKLRVLAITYYGFDSRYHRGRLVLHTSAVSELTAVLGKALDKRFPILKMRNVTAYRGDDVASMEAGNTSAFNCRKVVSNPYRLSRHSWGDAVDVNPRQNPYQATNGTWYPEGSAAYRDRSPLRKGMHGKKTVVPVAMKAEGWLWGARWKHPDYHHFSRTGQ